jgi:hypothetical protein
MGFFSIIEFSKLQIYLFNKFNQFDQMTNYYIDEIK